MPKEYELQVLDVDKSKMINLLKKNGGQKTHKNIRMVRSIFKRCNTSINGAARVRSEGKNTTMTVKIYKDKKFPEEYEVTIKEDFEAGKQFLTALNLKMKSYQETYREKWSLPINGVHEITFDTWPGIPTFMEIDCTSEKTLNHVKNLLNIQEDKITYGAAIKKYNLYYGIPEEMGYKIKNITFKELEKNVKPRKNKDLFKRTITAQRKSLR